ncbi:MAG TPA: cupredoxin domain-containing protein [Pyrinomonadaceae bacterium]|jgi:hypothetical protein|nr:cupredoxin domain-containing protein [Pyrinomonadaceae bacterium]
MITTAIKLFLTLIFSATVLFTIGCQKTPPPVAANEQAKTAAPAASAIKVELKTDPVFVEPGKEVELSLTIKNEKDELIGSLANANEYAIALTAISQDLSQFYDLTLKPFPDGTYLVRHTFPTAGRYTLFLDVKTPDGKLHTEIIGFGIAGDVPAGQELKADNSLVQAANGLKVELKPESEIKANDPVRLFFNVSDAKANEPASDLEKYKGEDMHLVIVSQDLKEFIHVERPPGSDDPEKDKMQESQTGGIRAARTIPAYVTFPKGGLYKIWAQFRRQGKVVTFPFVVKVKAAEGEIDYSKIEIPKGAIRVTVSKEGFTPKAIEVKAGQQVTLAFIRIDQENCGTEVEFPGLNLKKDLPLGKVVTIDIPAEKPGEFNFACGMNMLKGIVMVE